MRKILSILTLVFLVGLVAVNAEKVDISRNMKNYILGNYKQIKLMDESLLFYYNPNVCTDCEESKKVINDLIGQGYSIYTTTNYLTTLSISSLAMCMNDYSTRVDIKPGEIKDYADYCKTFVMPSGGIFSLVPKKEKTETEIILEPANYEDIIYITIGGDDWCFIVNHDTYNPKIQAMGSQELQNLIENVRLFVMGKVWDPFNKLGVELQQEEYNLYKEKESLTSLSTPESDARLTEINKRITEIDESQQKLRNLYNQVMEDCNLDLLKDYSSPFEGEVVDGFTLKVGTPPQPKYPKNIEEFFFSEREEDYGDQIIYGRLSDVYIFVEDEAKQKSIPAEEKPATEEELVVEEQPVTGINRIINPIKKLFTGEPEKAEEIPQQQPEQPVEQPKEEKKEWFITRFFRKIFSWF